MRTQIEEDRAEYWAHFGPEKHAAAWAALDARVIESLARMRAEGIDPNEVGAPSYRNKKITWPTF